jgi:uncharacterized membrane protein YidH (DUF202 family)
VTEKEDPPTVGAAFRRAPLVLRLAGLCYVVLLVAAVAVAFANSSAPALDPLLGLFGLSAATVGALVLLDVSGSADAALQWGRAIAHVRGHERAPTLRRQRLIAAVLVVVGLVFAVLGLVTGIRR